MIKLPNEEYNTQYGEIITNPFFIKDRELFEIFKRGIPPKEAYYFFPKGKDVLEEHNKKPEKNLRRIFINVPFLEIENKWLDKYKEIIAKHPENKLPDYWNDGLNLAYIYATECKLEQSYKRMIEYFKWYKSFFPLNIQPGDKVVQVLNSGFLYVFGRDHRFRPLLICQPYILQKCLKLYSDDDIYNASIFICQYMANYMLIPGQIENWIMFISLEGTSLLRMPDSVKKLITALSDYFIARLYKSYILGMNAFLRIIFKFMCNFLEEVTVKKFVILEGKKDKHLFQDINQENLEERFGGQAQNCIYDEPSCLFPPRMPSNNYFLSNEDAYDILISEEDYIERYNNGNIPEESVSPFVIERIKKEKKLREKEEMAKKIKEEALIKRNEAKTKAELNINTTWISENESFDLDKFHTSSDGFLEGIKSFRNMKDKFCSSIMTLNDHSTNDENFD